MSRPSLWTDLMPAAFGGGGSNFQRHPDPQGPQMVDPDTGNVQPVGQSGWTLAMSEEFNGSITVTDAPNGLVKFRSTGYEWATWYPNWSMFTSQSPGGNHTNTDQEAYYATSKVSLDGAGSLVLACDKQTTVAGLDYTGGMIQSLGFFTPLYGYFEARIKVATAAVSGHWPAWWASASATNTWPPEIDIWEYYGSEDPTYYNNTYVPSQSGLIDHDQSTTNDSYHVYGCKWTSSQVVWYRDGTQTTATTSASSQVPQSALYLILNNGARSPANPTFSGCDISVDYVRAWS